ncbi:toll like receptor adaptor molecule 1 [Willisornis vidua]|uniref:TIR domain-containing adapter molecule 1 n=1 Tax=Willisornis vidua TaxID=1566151 RepID=A0ABQ9DRX5_9PASS|nr:toll like receptor adaptor molecule 1 [Willisornis vidua]
MAQSTELQPGLEDIFNILSQVPQDKLLSLKHKLKHLIRGPSSRLLQAMVLLTLGQETDARICLDALRDNPAAQYVQQAKLGAAGVQQDGEDPQPPQLDAGAMALLAQVYEVLAQEKLCSAEAWDKACQAATKACQDTQKGIPNDIPPEDQDKHGFAASMGPSDRFRTLRSDEGTGFLRSGGPNYVVRSSPVQIRGHSDLSAPQTLCSVGSSSLTSCLEISASPTVVLHSQSPPQPSRGHPHGDTDRPSPQESSWPSSASPQPGQDTGAQVPQAEEALQGSSCPPALPAPEMPLPSGRAEVQPAQGTDVPSTATEPPAPRENMDEKQEEKQDEKELSTGLPDPGAAVGTDPTHVSIEDSYVPADIPSNSTSASISTCSLPPPPPTYSFSSTLPSLQKPPPSLNPPPLCSSPSPAWPPPPPVPGADPVALSEPEGDKFFTFVVLHASEDELVAHRVKNLLESLGVPNGATLCEDFFIAGRSHMTCFQEAMENSAFMILLLTKNFPCNLCLFQTDTALMQSILDPAKRDSVIPFLPRENALERSALPSTLRALVTLDESTPLFPRNVLRTFSPERISQKKALWEQMQRRKLQLWWERQQAQHNLAGLSLGSHPRVPPAATQPWPPGPPHQWCPPSPRVPPPAQMGPLGPQALLPPGHYNIPPLVIQNARMVQIGHQNTMQVDTVPPGPQDSE